MPGNARRLLIAHACLMTGPIARCRFRSASLGGFHYVALGHIHKPMEKRLADGFACYPGRIEGGGFDDPHRVGGGARLRLERASAGAARLRLARDRARGGISRLRSLDELRACLTRLGEQRELA
ncbi:MAG: hypothetical protein U0527_05905 [Candidatus Eisenbacteria bacterium]